jgi:hypothetical protein
VLTLQLDARQSLRGAPALADLGDVRCQGDQRAMSRVQALGQGVAEVEPPSFWSFGAWPKGAARDTNHVNHLKAWRAPVAADAQDLADRAGERRLFVEFSHHRVGGSFAGVHPPGDEAPRVVAAEGVTQEKKPSVRVEDGTGHADGEPMLDASTRRRHGADDGSP